MQAGSGVQPPSHSSALLATQHTSLPFLLPLCLQAQVRYLLRVTVARSLGGSVVKDHAFWVRNTQEVPPLGPPIKVRRGGGEGALFH